MNLFVRLPLRFDNLFPAAQDLPERAACPPLGSRLYRRIELTSKGGAAGEFRCLVCEHIIELMDGSTDVAFRLTVQPGKTSYAY
ncbi:hypothetical protein ACVI1L_002150 [Bradyrhizobium sp. USDA 4516]